MCIIGILSTFLQKLKKITKRGLTSPFINSNMEVLKGDKKVSSYIKELTTKLNSLYNILDLINHNVISDELKPKLLKDINDILDILRMIAK